MKLRSIELIKSFGTDELTSEVLKTIHGNSITIEAPDFSKGEHKELFQEIQEIQRQFPELSRIDIEKISSGKDVDTILANLDLKATDNIFLMGKIDGADFSRISEFEKLKYLTIRNNEQSNENELESTKADIGTIKLPPNIEGLNLFNISQDTKVDISNLSPIAQKSIKYRSESMPYEPTNLLHINDASELSFEDLDRIEEEGKVEYISMTDFSSNPRKNGGDVFHDWTSEFSPAEYRLMLSKLYEIVDGIDEDLPEEQKVKTIYERVSKNIEYDFPAAFPKDEKEAQYAEAQLR